MATALNTFLNRMTTNPIRNTAMFEMQVTSGYDDVDAVLQYITMYGQNFEIPNRVTNYADVSFKGQAFPFQTNQSMGTEHSMTVNADVDGEIRRAFLAWQGKNWNPDFEGGSVLEGDRRLNTGSIIRIHLLNANMDGISETYKMVGVKIGEIGPLTVSNSEANITQFTVNFRSTFWQIEKDSVAQGALASQT